MKADPVVEADKNSEELLKIVNLIKIECYYRPIKIEDVIIDQSNNEDISNCQDK